MFYNWRIIRSERWTGDPSHHAYTWDWGWCYPKMVEGLNREERRLEVVAYALEYTGEDGYKPSGFVREIEPKEW